MAVDAKDTKIADANKGVTDVQGSKNIKAEIDTKVGNLIQILSIIWNIYFWVRHRLFLVSSINKYPFKNRNCVGEFLVFN